MYDILFNIHTILDINTPDYKKLTLPSLNQMYDNIYAGDIFEDLSKSYMFGVKPDLYRTYYKHFINRLQSDKSVLLLSTVNGIDPVMNKIILAKHASYATDCLNTYTLTGIV